VEQLDLGSGSGGGDDAAGGTADEPVLVALGAGPEPAAALEAVPLVAAVAGGAEHVALGAAAGAAAAGRRGGDDAPELAGLVEAPHLLGAADVAAAHEDLGQRHAAARRVGQERGQLRQVARVHGQVALVDGGAEPAQDGAHRAAVLVGAADHPEGGEVQHHPPAAAGARCWLLAAGGGLGRGMLERAEDPERGGGDAEAVEDARRRGGGGVRRKQGPEVLETRVGDGEARARADGGGGGGGGADGGVVRAARLDPGRPHGDGTGDRCPRRTQAGSASGRERAALRCWPRPSELCRVVFVLWDVGFMRWGELLSNQAQAHSNSCYPFNIAAAAGCGHI
jgi:hypothetical protein